MKDDILQEKDFNEIVLNYQGEDGNRITVKSELRYADDEVCFFGFPLPLKYVKPKKKSDIFINACTPNGLYRTKVKFMNADLSFNEILYQVSLPKTWVVTQRRNGTRKEIHLPLKIKFYDETEIETISADLSVGGISFTVKQDIPLVNQNRFFTTTLQFEEGECINFDDNKLSLQTRLLRHVPAENGEVKCACCFVGVSKQIKEALRNYIMMYE